MVATVINGKSYDIAADFVNYGYNTVITAGTGESLPRYQALAADIIAQSSKVLYATSASSVLIGTGSKTFVLAADTNYTIGSYVTITKSDDATKYMFGQVTSYTSATKTLIVNVTTTGGSGTYTTWTLNVSGPVGPTGADTASGKKTLAIPASAMRARSSNGCAPLAVVAGASNQPDKRTLDFDASAIEYAEFDVPMPKSWDEGTVTAQFLWSHAATATNFGVVWSLQGVAISDDDTHNVNFGTAVSVTDTGGTTNDLYISAETSAITLAGTPAEMDLVCFRVAREATHGSDTLAIDARLHGIRLFYTTNAGNDA